ncbi:MAG: Ig-like domain-containing protein [Rubrivivax sp.]
MPPQHVFTPPGTVCASCHNSVIARPLNDASLACAQPQASELPTISTTASIGGAIDDAGGALASGALTNDNTPELRGTLSAPLGPNQQLAIMRNSVIVGAAAVSSTAWRFVDATGDGTQRYTARVVNGNGFRPTGNAFTLVVDSTPPTATAVADFAGNALGAVAISGFMTDTTPRINGTLTGTLAADEAVQVLRNGGVAGTATVGAGGTWSFTEPAALTLGPQTYQARVVDAAGNLGSTSAAATLTL